MRRTFTLAMLSTLLVLIGCEYDVPITAKPTREIEASLLGDWTSTDWTDKDCKDQMKARKYDESSYIVSNNGDLYRAWHSDVAGTTFLTVQNLDSADRKYSYFAWSLSDGGKRLTLQRVNSDLIPKETRDSATVVKILQANSGSSQLFEETTRFTRKK
ncbi:MAG: hypothetical protein ACXW29_08735 [Thermoanaerobaculia bacterium]